MNYELWASHLAELLRRVYERIDNSDPRILSSDGMDVTLTTTLDAWYTDQEEPPKEGK